MAHSAASSISSDDENTEFIDSDWIGKVFKEAEDKLREGVRLFNARGPRKKKKAA
ncbi:hypothetical protein FA13DRAFT_1731127 [Coprinellus micaceus]|jgi:hypothetical protein|uniref:Uncharacterized protein n=1 Tax=Coprinellus micaceus TaxID=71717 RepID=A0A4Y7SMX7_COPMI|nr:hypothetical protein FA13DRAFT_1740375 [Coprinellus micaceus]TEB28491.1 hypothetical protein FA13DRAFT_1735631 [Coprinellus micaceus]TEB29135.1 hypothetical protein FA13DRAFT_1735250 [Coprinellus micaceus]TEB32641.1 hypothetical protein FA13DRAFT_1731127 [Coprinellus micaceus]